MRCMVRDGVLYVLGKCFAYTMLALVFILGGQIDGVRHFLETYGEPALGPLLIVVALLMTFFALREKYSKGEHHHEHHHLSDHVMSCAINSRSTIWRSCVPFLLGITFAMAFCPYSGVLYFGTLIPLTLSVSPVWSWTLPIAFGLGDALPVFVISWLLSKGAAGIGKIGGNMQRIEAWLRWLCVVVFLGFGLYLSISHLSGHHHHEEISALTYTRL